MSIEIVLKISCNACNSNLATYTPVNNYVKFHKIALISVYFQTFLTFYAFCKSICLSPFLFSKTTPIHSNTVFNVRPRPSDTSVNQSSFVSYRRGQVKTFGTQCMCKTVYTREKKSSYENPFYGTKLALIQAVWAGQGRILPLVKWGHFFICP